VANVEWLLRESMDEWALRTGQRNIVDDERWRSSIERLQLGPGLRVFLFEAVAHQDVTLEMNSEIAQRWMGGQVTISGRAELDFLDGVRTQPSADQALMFRPSRRGAQAAAFGFRAGTTFHSAGYSLEVERVVRLFDGDVPEVLQGMVDSDFDRSRVVAVPTDRPMRHLARSLFGGTLNGSLRTLMMEGAVIQLLAVQADAAARERRSRRRTALSARERDAVHEAQRLLLADMRRSPTLGELALAVGLSEKRLNAGFRLLFGATAFEVLRNERLAQAEIALKSPQASLKEIAFRVGYNHVNNFINAFSRRYGAPPRQYAERLHEH
jgi:AraC-like DNA-binding protein